MFRRPSATFIRNYGAASSSTARQLSWQACRPIRDSIYIPLVSIHDWSCLSDPYGLFDPLAILLHYLSITFVPSQSMMQLFLSAWSVIADVCSITVDTLFCSLVNRLVVMFSTSFLYSYSLVSNVHPVSPIYVWLHLLQGIWYTQSVFLLFSTLSFGCTSILLMFR